MGKKRAAAVRAVAAAPIFPFPATDAIATQPDHFSDYGFDPQLVHFFSQQPEAKRPWSRRHHHHQPSHSSKPLESTRFKLQKPISKKHHHEQHQRRRWWSSAALLLLKFKRRSSSSSSSSSSAAAAASPTYWSAASVPAVPLYLADDDGPSACTCWAPNGPVRRPGRMAAAELGDAAVSVPYVSIRSTGLGGAGRAGGDTPAMPIYLVT